MVQLTKEKKILKVSTMVCQFVVADQKNTHNNYLTHDLDIQGLSTEGGLKEMQKQL